MKNIRFIIPALLLHATASYSQGTPPDSTLSQGANNAASIGNSAPVHRLKSNDQVLPRWAIDLNYRGGWLNQDIKMINLKAAYVPNNLSSSHYVEPVFSNGRSNGGDIQLSYFFNKSRTLGVGTGAMYMRYTGNTIMDTLYMDYQKMDGKDRIYRRILYSNQELKEDIKINNVNIPLLLKFKHQFGRPERPSNFGITADAGPVFGIYNQTTATASGSFSYEAIYKLDITDPKHAIVSGFDSSTSPANGNTNTSLVLTNAAYAGREASFDDLYNQKNGFNVGLNKTIAPALRTQDGRYTAVSLGAMVQAGISYALSYNIVFNVSGYYLYQSWQNTSSKSYKPTEDVVEEGTNVYGNYTPLTNGIEKSQYSSYGIAAGFRIFFGEKRDVDGDHIRDTRDKCKQVYGEERFGGCPDSDHDGIADIEDDCAYEPGGETTNGCPDDDNDGVPNKSDLCPLEYGELKNGCPINTKYAPIADIDSTLKRENGTLLPPHQVLETDVLHFAFARADIQDSVAKVLDFAAKLLIKEPKIVVYISGYTDDIGNEKNNVFLSYQRAKSAKIYLIKKGISEDHIIIGGYGMENPITPNDSPENRAKNRRIEMKLLLPL